MSDTSLKFGPELTITDLNGALHSYCIGHQANFPGTPFDKAAVAFMAQCPTISRCYAHRQIKPEERQAVAGEALNALSKQYQLKHKTNFLDAFHAVCKEHPLLKNWYAGTEEDEPVQTYAADGGTHGPTLAEQQQRQAEAGNALDKIAKRIQKDEPSLSYSECFRKACAQHPDLAEMYHGIKARVLA